jgi:hypothetical protein
MHDAHWHTFVLAFESSAIGMAGIADDEASIGVAGWSLCGAFAGADAQKMESNGEEESAWSRMLSGCWQRRRSMSIILPVQYNSVAWALLSPFPYSVVHVRARLTARVRTI